MFSIEDQYVSPPLIPNELDDNRFPLESKILILGYNGACLELCKNLLSMNYTS